MIRPERRVQAEPLHPLRPARPHQRRATLPPLSDVVGYLVSVGTILWLGAQATRLAEGR